jgi:hypothetical protein
MAQGVRSTLSGTTEHRPQHKKNNPALSQEGGVDSYSRSDEVEVVHPKQVVIGLAHANQPNDINIVKG